MITIDKNRGTGTFITGFSSTFRAFPFILKNSMLRFLILPLIVNISLMCAIIWLVFIKAYPVLHSIFIFDQWYLQWIQYLAAPLLVILLLIAAFFTYSITGTIIVSPFLDIISLKTENAIGGIVPDPGFTLKGVWRMLTGMIKLLVLMLFLYIIVLPVNLIPVLGTFFYSALSFLLTAFFCGFQFYDMPLERRGFTFSEKFRVGREFASTVTGTGAAFILMSFVPVIGFLGIVVSACGATIAFREIMDKSIARKN